MQSYAFDAIGIIESCYKERFGTPRQAPLAPASWAILRLRPELNLQDGLTGLENFSHLWIIFVFHQNTNKNIKTKIHPPRMNGEKIGVFATRSPHRPNPIGLSVVKLEKIENNLLFLSGIDFIDGTPVLDMKPYVPSVDIVSGALAGWTGSRPERTVEVRFNDQALKELAAIKDSDRLRQLIIETLELDPRPTFYKGTVENENPYMDVYGFRVSDYNVRYRMRQSIAEVLEIEPWPPKE